MIRVVRAAKRNRRSTRRRYRRVVLWMGFGLVGLVCFAGWQAWTVRENLKDVRTQLVMLSREIQRADHPAAEQRLRSARRSADAAEAAASGPVWWLGARLPWVGDDLSAIQTVADVAQTVTRKALPQLVEASGLISGDGLKPSRGRIDLDAVAGAAPPLRSASVVLTGAADQVRRLPTRSLVGPLRNQVGELNRELDRADDAVRLAAQASELLPDMLGRTGARSYLLVFQNNANARNLGGMAGAVATLRATRGSLELAEQGGARDLGMFARPIMSQPKDEMLTLGSDVVRESTDVANIPDFPRNAEVYQRMWLRTHRERVDGVISLDTVALSGFLRATGAITVGGRTLTADNATQELLSEAYLRLGDEAQDEFYANAARAIFTKISSGDFDSSELVRQLASLTSQRRIMMWSARQPEQEQIAGTALANELPTADLVRPEIGVYVSDAGNDKLTYYLRHEVSVVNDRCALGAQRMRVSVRLRYLPPEQALTSSVLGPPVPGLRPGTMVLYPSVYAPAGGRVDQVVVNGEARDTDATQYKGRPVAGASIELQPGDSAIVEYTIYSARGQSGPARVLTTPGIDPAAVTIGPSAC